jgi:hypothetical protein
MKTSFALVTLFAAISILSQGAFAKDCSTVSGQKQAIQEYISNGNPVPACGPDCANNFVLSQVCPCATETGLMGLAKEFVLSGQAVPSCGPQCAFAYIQSNVCDGLNVKPNCFTQSGKEAIVQDYLAKGKPVPACGPDCARQFILSQSCAASSGSTNTNEGSSSAPDQSGTSAASAQ